MQTRRRRGATFTMNHAKTYDVQGAPEKGVPGSTISLRAKRIGGSRRSRRSRRTS